MNRNQMKLLLEEYSCPICFELMNSETENTAPKTLHCSHTICKGCLSELHSRHVEGSVMCPKCRHITAVHLERIATNFTMVNTIETLKTSFDAVSAKYVACGNCEENRGSSHCLDCSLIYCDICCAAHGVLKCNKAHKVVPMKTLDLKKPYCPLDESESTLYCEGCLKFICTDCRHSHTGGKHKVMSIEEQQSKCLGEVQVQVKFCSDALGKHNEYIDQLTTLLQELPLHHQKLTEQVDQTFDQDPLLLLLNERREATLNCIDHEIIAPINQLANDCLREYKSSAERLETLIMTTEQTAAAKSPADLITSKPALMTALQHRALPYFPRKPTLPTVKIDFSLAKVKYALTSLCLVESDKGENVSNYSLNQPSDKLVLVGTVVFFTLLQATSENCNDYSEEGELCAVTTDSTDDYLEYFRTQFKHCTEKSFSPGSNTCAMYVRNNNVNTCVRVSGKYVLKETKTVQATMENGLSELFAFFTVDSPHRQFTPITQPKIKTALLCYEYL